MNWLTFAEVMKKQPQLWLTVCICHIVTMLQLCDVGVIKVSSNCSSLRHLNISGCRQLTDHSLRSLNKVSVRPSLCPSVRPSVCLFVGSRTASFKWPLLSVDMSDICLSATLMLNISETKLFRGFVSNRGTIGKCLWCVEQWRRRRRHMNMTHSRYVTIFKVVAFVN